MTNRQVWKKENLRFTYFPELGHALDRRDAHEDVVFRPIDAEARKKLVMELQEFF